jgi:flagellar basal-body rod modification protein FlgD
MTDPITPTGTSMWTSSPVPPAATAGNNDAMNKDMFLKLLVAQLKYQDPSNPTDSSAFMAQTAQYSMVEKLDTLTTQNADLVTAQRLMGASAMVGRTVSYTNSDGTDVKGVVTSARFSADGAVLHIGDTDVPIDQVKEVTTTQAS